MKRLLFVLYGAVGALSYIAASNVLAELTEIRPVVDELPVCHELPEGEHGTRCFIDLATFINA